jgi:peptidoglycan/LPS O-acetylase OafA/YrhL
MIGSKTRILGFDGLRAIAFVLVFISHKAHSGVGDRYGTAGVWLFFVLSGFLITRILANHRSDIEAGYSTVGASMQDFYIRRTLRIFPVYYLFLAILTVAASLGFLDLGGAWRQLSYWLYLGNIYIEFHDWGPVGHLWSLAVEEQFYLLFAPLALLLPLKRLPLTCASLVALSVAAHLALLGVDAGQIHFDANSFVNFGLLGLGGLAGLAADRPLPPILRSSAAIAAALVAYLALPALIPRPEWLQFGRMGGLLAALLLIQLHQSQTGLAVAWLNWAPLRRLGVISYGAYLFHPVIKCAPLVAAAGVHGAAAQGLGALLDFAATVALAGLSWRYFEAPVRNLAGRGRPPAQEPVPLS